MSLWLSGIGVSRGIAIARVQKMHGGDLDAPEYALEPGQVEAEVTRYNEAHRQAHAQLRDIRDRKTAERRQQSVTLLPYVGHACLLYGTAVAGSMPQFTKDSDAGDGGWRRIGSRRHLSVSLRREVRY